MTPVLSPATPPEPDAGRPQISAKESNLRARAIRNARASVALEGGELPAECDEIDRKYIAGELTSAEHFAAYARLAGRQTAS